MSSMASHRALFFTPDPALLFQDHLGPLPPRSCVLGRRSHRGLRGGLWGWPWRPIVDPFETLAGGGQAVSGYPSQVSFTPSFSSQTCEQRTGLKEAPRSLRTATHASRRWNLRFRP